MGTWLITGNVDLGQQGDQTRQLYRKSTLNGHRKDWCWSASTLTTQCEASIHWKRLWCWEKLRAGGEEGDRGWDGWMVSPTQWTRVWANPKRWWRIRKLDVLQFLASQRVVHNLATEQQQMLWKWCLSAFSNVKFLFFFFPFHTLFFENKLLSSDHTQGERN